MIWGILVKQQNCKIIYLLYVLIVFTILCIGCTDGVAPVFSTAIEGPTRGTILIEKGAETTFDRTPTLTISSEKAAYMSFSGDGLSWSEWLEYNAFYGEVKIFEFFLDKYPTNNTIP